MDTPKYKDVFIEADPVKKMRIRVIAETSGRTYEEVLACEGRKFRIGFFSPTIGSMTMLQLTKMLTDESVYALVQANCFNVCSVYIKTRDGAGNEIETPMRMFAKENPPGKQWLVPSCPQLDAGTSTELMTEVLNFNLDPFMLPSAAPDPGTSAMNPSTSPRT
jgi:hypothetical protein